MKTRGRKKKGSVKEVEEEPLTVVDIDEFETVCHVCDAEFLDEGDLKLHVAQVHLHESKTKTVCKFCCTIVCNAEAFVSHFIFKHLENSAFCYYCYRVFADPVLLDQHELKHCAVADDSALTCSQCSSIYSSRQILQTHEFKEHRNSMDGLMLNSFFPLLSSKLNVKINKFLDCLYKKAPLICRKCNHSTLSIKKYIEHLKTLKCQCFACDKCFNVYKKKHSIANHLQNQPQCQNYVTEKESQKSCPKCEKYFNPKDIIEHKKFCNIIKCLTCKKLFNSMYELTDHRKEEHQASINLKVCKYCKKEFVGILSLKKHMRRSHKNKNMYKYNCVYCGLIFTHPSKLFAHFFTRHKHIEPYTCKICNKCFRLRKHFTIHIKLHHMSIGFVEFDKNLHVNFTDKKSENPVNPNANMGSTTDASDSDCSHIARENRLSDNRIENQPECKEKDVTTNLTDNGIDTSQSTVSLDQKIVSNDTNILKVGSDLTSATTEIEIKQIKTSPKLRHKRKKRKAQAALEQSAVHSLNQLSSNSSEEEPLSNVRESLLREKSDILSNLNRRMAIRDKRNKLTCKICNKYCYTVQNYHHHLTLHEKRKLKRCIKCHKYFKTRKELKDHISSTHSSSKLIETLKSVLEKRKKNQSSVKPSIRPSESLKSLLEKRKKAQKAMTRNLVTNKFQRTIKKVNIIDDCTATITPMSDHGLSVKNFIENFKPETDTVSISNSVTIKAVTAPLDREPSIKMLQFNPEPPSESYQKLNFPVKFKDSPEGYVNGKVRVQLVQQLITKHKLVNMTVNDRIPVMQDKTESEYCNMFADETDYTQYKNDIPEVAHEVMLGDPEDIPRTRRLAQEIIIPKIPEKYGGVRIGHLLPQAPYYKIVKVKKLLENTKEPQPEAVIETNDKDVKLPDGTRLISVKNPYSHLIANEHLEEILKANKSKYYTPKAKNIEKALAKALSQTKPPRERKTGKRTKTRS